MSVHFDILAGYNKRDLQGATDVNVGNFPSCFSSSKLPQLDKRPPSSFFGQSSKRTPHKQLPTPLENVQTERSPVNMQPPNELCCTLPLQLFYILDNCTAAFAAGSRQLPRKLSTLETARGARKALLTEHHAQSKGRTHSDGIRNHPRPEPSPIFRARLC